MVKRETIYTTKLDTEFSFAVRLAIGMLHYSLWEMLVCGRTVTRNLNFLALNWTMHRLTMVHVLDAYAYYNFR